MKCPRCGGPVLASAEIPVIVMSVGPNFGTGIPFGTSFLVHPDTLAVCNKHGCKWSGRVSDLKEGN